MWTWLQQQWAKFRSRRRGEMGEKPLIDIETIELTLERSPVPAVMMLVLVWAVCSVLLIMSHQGQSMIDGWIDGQKAPYSINARVDFSYVDNVQTEEKRKKAGEDAPKYYRIDDRLTGKIDGNIAGFFRNAVARSERNAAAPAVKASPQLLDALVRETAGSGRYSAFRKNLQQILKQGIRDVGSKSALSLPGRLAGRVSPRLLDALVRECTAAPRRPRYDAFRRKLQKMLKQGILADDANQKGGVKIVDSVGRIDKFQHDNFPTVSGAANELAQALFPEDKVCRDEFRKVLAELIGRSGNLELDRDRTDKALKEAAEAVAVVKVHVARGEPLVRKGQVVTAEIRERVRAWQEAMPKSGLFEAYRLMAWSFFLLGAMVFFVCMVSPRIRGDNLRIVIASLTMVIAMFFCYESIRLFNFMSRDAQVRCEDLLQCAVPVALCSVILAIILDIRTAICCGALVSVITAMMIMPERSLELALRWSAISSVAALLVTNVTNYRAFFVRTVGSVCCLTWAMHLDVIFKSDGVSAREQLLKEASLLILSNAVFCAMTALVLIFVFELVFNLSTNMALMVLSDCNHPLLERLKREAPGTMAHSMAVATLAEDAARAIGANPLRAKAGALFHDIGKLSMPQYFTENNPDSALQHAALTPQMSSSVIRDHVKEGLVLARQRRLCRFIREVIASHHGDDLVRFFFHRAQEMRKPDDPPVLESQFRYNGEPPTSREAGIISLADACEAASRSLKHPTPENIADMVHNIIEGRFKGGQLRNSRLTAADLDLIAKSFIATLSSSMHGRIAYPEEPANGSAKGKKAC